MVGCLHNKQRRKYWSEKWQESLALPLHTLSLSYSLSYKIFFSPFNSGRHSENADAIADVKSKIIVSRQHFFVDVIYPAT